MRTLIIAVALFGAVPVFVGERQSCIPCIDFAGQGVPVKRLNGMCNTIPMKGNVNPARTNLLTQQIRALEIPETRFHDVVADNAGIQLVDVSRIFPLFRADENDPLNYDFRPTDLYLARARELGGELEFRFGEQIEHQGEQFQMRPPADIGKWARICVNIARHYNDGWANGYKWNIRRFSVWEVPDNDLLFTGATKGSYETCYFKMYAAVARGIKGRWPEAHVGGPNCCRAQGLRVNSARATQFRIWATKVLKGASAMRSPRKPPRCVWRSSRTVCAKKNIARA